MHSGEKIRLKRVIRAGRGLSVYITKEAKKMKLEYGDYVTLEVLEDSIGEKIEIRKAKIV